MADKLTLAEIATMSAPRELNHPDDFVILTLDVLDSPLAKLRLSKIYNVETSTLNDDYLLVLQDYITQQLESTPGLDNWSRSRLLDAHFCTLHRRDNGDLLVSLRKPATERLIRQTIQGRLDALCPVSVSLFIQFKTPGFRIPQRLHKPIHIPLKICEKDQTSSDFGSHATVATLWNRGMDILHEAVTPHMAVTLSSKLIFIRTIKHDHNKSNFGPPISTLLQDASSNGIDVITLVTSGIKSNLLEQLVCEPYPVSHGNAFDPKTGPAVFADITSGLPAFSVTGAFGTPPTINSNEPKQEDGSSFGGSPSVVKDINWNDPIGIIPFTLKVGTAVDTGNNIVGIFVGGDTLARLHSLLCTNATFTHAFLHHATSCILTTPSQSSLAMSMLYQPFDRGRPIIHHDQQ
jgi:hypothetical protein